MQNYIRVNWKNGDEGGTPLSSDNLNQMDQQIELVTTAITLLETETKSIEDTIGSIGATLDSINGKVV